MGPIVNLLGKKVINIIVEELMEIYWNMMLSCGESYHRIKCQGVNVQKRRGVNHQ